MICVGFYALTEIYCNYVMILINLYPKYDTASQNSKFAQPFLKSKSMKVIYDAAVLFLFSTFYL